MNKKCIITTKKNIKNIKDTDIYFLEDYIEFSNIKEAEFITNRVYQSNTIYTKELTIDGYSVPFVWYDRVYQIALKYLEIQNMLTVIRNKHYDTIVLDNINSLYNKVIRLYFFDKEVIIKNRMFFKSNLKQFTINSILLCFNMISVIYFFLKNDKRVGIKTEDMIFKGTKSDFRFNYMYQKIEENNIKYVEFIRTKSLRHFFKNFFIRKRFAIYYDALLYFSRLFTSEVKYENKPTNFYESILFDTFHNSKSLINTIPYMKLIYKLCHIKNVFVIHTNSRTGLLVLTAKLMGIKSIGFKHGFFLKSYAPEEFMLSYNGVKKIGPDVYGVWSDYFVKYFQENCKIIERENIYNCGLLRPIQSYNNSPVDIKSKKIKVLIISEPLVSPKEIYPYIKKLMEDDRFELGIKVRPMINDEFFEALKDIYPQIEGIPKHDGKILDDGAEYDIFLGSHSTAVIEASLIGKLSLLVWTKKWQDYFDIDTLVENKNLLITDPEYIANEIVDRINSENSIHTAKLLKDRFFGDNKDGVEWIIQQMKNV